MNLEQYKIYWAENNEQLFTLSKQDFNEISKATNDFLVNWGLPSALAPFLSFDEIVEQKLSTVNEAYGIDWSELNSFIMFGTNGSGDPICIDINQNDAVVYLNHDDDFISISINKSIRQFAESLICYRNFINKAIDFSNIELALTRFTDQDFDELKTELLKIDDTSLDQNSFWTEELQGLIDERDQN